VLSFSNYVDAFPNTMSQNSSLCSPRPSSGLDPNVPIIVESARPQNIPSNHVLLRVDRFGFSANK
jgi:hypothetical protein